MKNKVHIELRNITTGLYYYVCYPEDPAGVIWTPDIRNHLYAFDDKMTVGEVFDIIRPIVDRLREGNTDKWHVHAFHFGDGKPQRNLTQPSTYGLGLWEVGDVSYIDGERRPTLFHSIYN